MLCAKYALGQRSVFLKLKLWGVSGRGICGGGVEVRKMKRKDGKEDFLCSYYPRDPRVRRRLLGMMGKAMGG